jgi:hypothetical protein
VNEQLAQRSAPRAQRGGSFAVTFVLAALLAAGCSSAGHKATQNATNPSTLAPIHGRYAPSIDPASFVAKVDNRFWPLHPGTGFHYAGRRGTTAQTDDEIVTHQTRRILGITATVVRDTVSEHGRPIERTLDYYAQDKLGNVWYLGEDSFELENGRFVKASDSWRSGVGGGKPGIIMPANPEPGESYRQEYYPPGRALDQAHVLGQRGPVTVPYRTFKRALVTSEFSPLEPQTEEKYYVAGVGEVLERVVKGHREEFQLVRITRHAR